ncbi:SMI1/KNR4 family protein [Pedobacter sp. UYP1]|uniref:SMI1/KNR4 family protein n=1 Tax=Pedobacter sp. UYP1 TaxID=1756396 RepID=UPI00339909C7
MKESEIKTMWSVPKYSPYIQPELTDEILLGAEKQLGCKLPKEYIKLLKIQNRGYTRFT